MLNSKQRAMIKKEAQKIKSSFQIGQNELHEGNIEAFKMAFNTKEIIKIKVNRSDNKDKEISEKMANEIASKVQAQKVCVIGTTIILYKKNDKLDDSLKI